MNDWPKSEFSCQGMRSATKVDSMFVPTCLFPVWLLVVMASLCSGLGRGVDAQRQEQRLQGAMPYEGFGEATAIEGDWAMIAAPFFSGNRGRVQVCRRQVGVWTASQVIESPTPQDQSLFGRKLTLSGDWLAISQESWNNTDPVRGAVHLYHRSAERWNFVQTLRGTQNGADFYRFGDGLDIVDGTLAVTDDVIRGFERASSVRLYRLRAASWELEQTLEKVTTRVNQAAVLTLKLHGSVLALGNPWRLSKEGWNVGEVKIFRRQSGASGSWKHEQTLLTDPKADSQRFGESVGFTDAGEMLATSSRSLWSSSWNGKLWSQPAVVEVKGLEAPLTNVSSTDIHISGSVAAVFLHGLRLLRRTESGWQLMRTLETAVVGPWYQVPPLVPPLAISADTVLYPCQLTYASPKAVTFVPLMELEVRLGAKTTLVSGYGQNYEQVQSGSQVSWRPWIDGSSLPLHVRNAGPSLLPFPTAQLSGTAAALFEIVGPTGAPSLLAEDAEEVFEVRPRSTLPQTDQTLTVTFSTGGTVLDYAFQVIWKSNASQSFAAPQVSLVKAVIHPKGQRLILTPSVNGNQTMTYRWSREGHTVPGQTRASLDLASLKPEDAGYYQVEVKSGTHTIFSNQCELVVFEPQSGVTPMRDDQSARFTTKVWGRASIKWQPAWESPYHFGLNTPIFTIVNGRYLRDNLIQEELSAVAVVGSYQGVPLASTIVARYSLRSVGRVPIIYSVYPSLFGAYGQTYEVGDTLNSEWAVFPFNAIDLDGSRNAWPGSFLEAKGLPPGITLDASQGWLNGTFTKAGVYRVTWSLTDFIGRKSAPFVTVIRVSQPRPPALPGVYAGIVSGSEFSPNFKLGGYLEMHMEAAGSFSGVLRVNAEVRRLAGRLKQVPNSPDKYECELRLPPLTGTKSARLVVRSTPAESAPTAQVIVTYDEEGRTDTCDSTLYFRAVGANLVTPELVGRYNALLEANLLDEGIYPPEGYSFMSLQLIPGTTAVAVGSLADGTGFTCACPVMTNESFLKLPFYLHNTAQGSTLKGELSVDVAGGTSTVSAEFEWRQIARPGARLYPEGFRLSLRGGGGRYIMPPVGYTLLAHGPDAPGNAIISPVPWNGEFEPTYFRLTSDHRALLPRSAPGLNHVTRIDFYAPTGFFTGEIILEPTTGEGEKRIPGGKVGFRGMMIPNLAVGGGFYHRRNIFLDQGAFVSKGVSIWRAL